MSDLVTRMAGIEPDSVLARVVAKRGDIFALTEKTMQAALTPVEPGGLPNALRAALASRVARLNGEVAMADHFASLTGDEAAAKAADLDFKGDDARSRAVIRHCDLVAANPKAATGGDIEALRQAGVSEPDIVRLSELVAFISYQVRVVAGLRLMRETL
jgi:uncharacterized protein YciW